MKRLLLKYLPRPSVLLLALVLLIGVVAPVFAAGQFDIGGIKVSLNDADASNEEIATAFQVLALLTILSLAPALLIVLTSFTRIIIVLAMLRHAFGMPSTPPNTVLVGLALFLTLFTMMPVLDKMDETAVQPFSKGELTAIDAAKKAIVPLRDFIIRQTR